MSAWDLWPSWFSVSQSITITRQPSLGWSALSRMINAESINYNPIPGYLTRMVVREVGYYCPVGWVIIWIEGVVYASSNGINVFDGVREIGQRCRQFLLNWRVYHWGFQLFQSDRISLIPGLLPLLLPRHVHEGVFEIIFASKGHHHFRCVVAWTLDTQCPPMRPSVRLISVRYSFLEP